jgi:hypothetical protein
VTFLCALRVSLFSFSEILNLESEIPAAEEHFFQDAIHGGFLQRSFPAWLGLELRGAWVVLYSPLDAAQFMLCYTQKPARAEGRESMAIATTPQKRKPKSAARRAGVQMRLRPQNRKLLRWLDSWLATPDDLGEAWWSEFEADLQAHRMTFRPMQAG